MSDWLVYAGYRFGAAIVGVLPRRVIARLGSAAGWLAWSWANDRKTMARRHMRRVAGLPPEPGRTAGAGSHALAHVGPEGSVGRRIEETDLDTREIDRKARGMFSAYGRYWAEVFWYRPSRFHEVERTIRIDGLEHLERPVAAGRPVVITLPHMGNWEMAATAAGRVGVRITAVAESLGNRRVTEWFLQLRASLSIDVVLTDAKGGVTRHLLEALRRGQTIALLNDRDLSGRGVEVEFFGETTTLPAGPAALAIRTDAAIVPVAAYFASDGGHDIVIEPEVVPPGGDTMDERVRATTQMLARVLERQVSRHPEQWHLVQPNWPSDRAAVRLTSGDAGSEE
jgi:KDO2-lipid IV(A) lauroyltransferase